MRFDKKEAKNHQNDPQNDPQNRRIIEPPVIRLIWAAQNEVPEVPRGAKWSSREANRNQNGSLVVKISPKNDHQNRRITKPLVIRLILGNSFGQLKLEIMMKSFRHHIFRYFITEDMMSE